MRLSQALIGGLFGLLFGSAINAIVWRLNVGRSWVRGRSQCPDCGHTLAARDLVPVLSWLMLGGKCRYCHKPIQDHPVVEVVTALAFGLSVYALNPVSLHDWVQLGFWLLMLVMLIILAAYDARWMILPDQVMVPLIVTAVLYAAFEMMSRTPPQFVSGPLVAAFLTSGAFLLLGILTRGRAIGGGDVKLAFAMGLILGLKGTAVALLLAFDVAAAIGILLIILKFRTRKDQIPFGPFLVLGTIVAYLYTTEIVDWYLRLNGVG
jgi:prepilin signal peptidase PulO-like enzyme (type II secretory pathway)